MNQLKCLPQEAIVWGHDILETAATSLGDYGITRPIIFTVEFLETLNRDYILPGVRDAVGIFTELPAHVPDFAVRKGLKACIDHGADSIIALGGGSVLDAAKAVSFWHFEQTGRHLPIAAFPTTLSGSEFSHYFGVTETDGPQKFKRSYAVRQTVPRLVVIDPRLITDTPRALLLSSAIKGIDHAVEGMRKVESDHPHAILAAKGVERFFTVLERWPQKLETRDALQRSLVSTEDLLQLQLGAWQCYFFPASVIYGLSHRIGHILGGTFGLPHSVTSCFTLAPVIRACADAYGDKFEIFASGSATSTAAESLADRLSSLVRSLGLPSRLSALDFDKAKLCEVSALLKDNYPSEVADLGAGAGGKLDALLESLW
ncbi:Alcohol dehydrogenase, class IV [Paraburkholderia piptadeniae]|uniref:Alcohol dehydrogenase, class IV n=1 Tax=Paraburkholderia piptadeniae TaxID=1701573 RepID=A0A1N7S9P8_9BURK|nr:iron-containing alcohol dehydrogenase [Paraburkholderia piptadeniae]SIT44117.1 Alcohol dehydrogenase, class IV [Paraburkholderia piptadeniae]